MCSFVVQNTVKAKAPFLLGWDSERSKNDL